MAQNSEVTFIRLDHDMDRPIYRIFPLWAFEDMLRVRRLMLVPPSFFDDPFEDLPCKIMMQGPNHKQKPLSDYLNAAFCQCWSFESESDSLLRAYSRVTLDKLHRRNTEPGREGVQIRTTPRKLANALEPWIKNGSPGQFYFGRVEYVTHDEASAKIGAVLGKIGPYSMGSGENRAQALLLKRKAFSHEDEARLIWVYREPRDASKPLTVNLEPNSFIDEVRFDPRLESFERIERQERARALEYTGNFSDSLLYQKALFQTQLPWNWEEWEDGEQTNQSSGDAIERE